MLSNAQQRRANHTLQQRHGCGSAVTLAAAAPCRRGKRLSAAAAAARRARRAAAAADGWDGDGVHHTAMEVRDYELDQFAVVNNGRFAGFLQHGRHKALAALGLSVEAFQAQGTLMALSELNLRYKAPLRAGDSFVVTTAVAAISAARLTLEQRVLRRVGDGDSDDLQLACDGSATVVFLDAAYKPIRAPAAVREAFDAKFSQRKAAAAAAAQ